VVGKGFDNVVHFNSKTSGLYHQSLNLLLKEPCLLPATDFRTRRDDGAYAWANFEKTAPNQDGNYLVSCIGIDLELLAESADGREGVTRAEAARDHGFSGGVNDLLVEFTTGLKLDVEGNHACTITCRTAKSRSRAKKWLDGQGGGATGTSSTGRVIRKREPARKLSYGAAVLGDDARGEAEAGATTLGRKTGKHEFVLVFRERCRDRFLPQRFSHFLSRWRHDWKR
jgi:hypothetical protein